LQILRDRAALFDGAIEGEGQARGSVQPLQLACDAKPRFVEMAMRRCGYARCEARKSHDLGLQVSCRVDNKVSVSGVGRRCRATGAGIAAGNRAGARDDHLRWSDQS
jgi:hypothetical protein